MIYVTGIYASIDYPGARAQEREYGAADIVPPGRAAAPRLRDPQTHRGALRRSRALARGVTLPAALPPGDSRLDSGALGGKARPASASLLSDNSRRPQGAGGSTQHLGGVRRCNQSGDTHSPCLTGSNTFESGLSISRSTRSVRRRSSRKLRTTSKIFKRTRAPACKPKKRQ